MSNVVVWLAVGFLGQALFTARFLVQWLASETKTRVDRSGCVLVAQSPGRCCASLVCRFSAVIRSSSLVRRWVFLCTRVT